MTFRLRLVLASMSVIVVGLGALLVLGNVLLAPARQGRDLDRRARATPTRSVRARGDGDRVSVRPTANDAALDRRGWVFDGDRVVERPAWCAGRARPAGPAPRPCAQARRGRRPGRGARAGGPVRLAAPARVGAVVVAYSVEPLERLQQTVLLASFFVAALVLLAGGLAIRSAINGALRPVARHDGDGGGLGRARPGGAVRPRPGARRAGRARGDARRAARAHRGVAPARAALRR